MEPLSSEQFFILNECLIDMMKVLNFKNNHIDNIQKVFYCGKANKYSVPNTLLVVVPIDKENIYFKYADSAEGCGGLSSCTHEDMWDSKNRKYLYYYKVITPRVFKFLNNDWTRLPNQNWTYSKNIKGLDITNTVFKYSKLKAFL